MRRAHRSASMKNYKLLIVGAVACTLAACSGDGLTRATPADLNGMWTQDFGNNFIPGISFVIGLSESAGAVTGSGSYAGEAAPYGQLAANGTAAGDSVHLRVIYTPNPTVFPQLAPDTAQFDGVLTTRDHIDGMLMRAGSAHAFALIRLHNGDRPQ